MKRTYCFLLFIIHHSLFTILHAQPGALDLTFNSNGTGANDLVKTIALQPDGRILIAGVFTQYNGQIVNGVARLLPDGRIDTTFKFTGKTTYFPTPPWGNLRHVDAIALQADGKILVGGGFDTINGYASKALVRLNPDGSADTTFNVGTGCNSNVGKITVQPDGNILVGGAFTIFNGDTVNRICRLLPDASLDPGWDISYGADGEVGEIFLQPDGKVMLGGDFVHYGGPAIGFNIDFLNFRIARAHADGTRDSTFASIPGASHFVNCIITQPNGYILVGGNFNQYAFEPRNRLTRLLPAGQKDLDFTIRTGTGVEAPIFRMVLLPNDDILAAGMFTVFNNQPAGRIFKLNYYGDRITNFQSDTGANNTIFGLTVQADGKILIGGAFDQYNNTPVGRIARLYNCLTPQPDSVYGMSYALCSGTQQTYTCTPVTGATKYEWTLPNGWTGASDSASITAISDGSGGVILVKAFTDSCGWSYATTLNIATIQPANVPICLVTVDTASTHNIIIWEKPATSLIDSFFIYRETQTNVYSKIAAVPYDSLSEYHDTAANPNATSFRYKLTVLDTCGAESDFSLYHNTIHLQYLGTGNFQWTFYQIEGQANPVQSFNFYRDALSNGSYFPIGNIPGTNATFTDLTWASFPNATYVVDVNWNISCTSTRAVSTTRSNIRRGGLIIAGINEELLQQVQVFPNPAGEIIYINAGELKVLEVKLFNALGQLAASEPAPVNALHVSALPEGIYTLAIETPGGRILKRIAVE